MRTAPGYEKCRGDKDSGKRFIMIEHVLDEVKSNFDFQEDEILVNNNFINIT